MPTALQTINASASPEVQINENFEAVAPSALFARKATTTAGLTWGYYGGILPGTTTNIADGTLTLPDNSTSYIECDDAGAIYHNASAFTGGLLGSPPSPRFPLYSVVTAGGLVTAYTDYRTSLNINLSGGGGGVTGPSGATDEAIVLFNGTTGAIIKDSATLLAALAQLGVVQSWTKAQRGTAPAGLTSTAGATAIDLDTGNNFTMTMTENSTLSAPSHPVQGQSGCIVITQPAGSPYTALTLGYNAFWKFPGGSVPTLTARAGAVDVFTYYIESGTRATCSLLADVK